MEAFLREGFGFVDQDDEVKIGLERSLEGKEEELVDKEEKEEKKDKRRKRRRKRRKRRRKRGWLI